MAQRNAPGNSGAGQDNNKTPVSQTGAARRRLIRAAGNGGIGIIAALAASGWKTPVIHLAVLPAHAQLSGQNACAVAVTSIITVSGPATFAASIFLRNEGNGSSTIVNSVTGQSNSSTQFSGSTTVPAGHFLFGITVTQGTSQAITVYHTASCCGNSPVEEFTPAATYTFVQVLALIDDGVCSLS